MMIQRFINLFSRIAPNTAARLAAYLVTTPMNGKRKPWERCLPEGSDTKQLTGGGALQSWHQNDRHALVIYGWSGRGTQMAEIIRKLIAQGFSVHLVHPQGHGPTDGNRSNPMKFVNAVKQARRLIARPISIAIGHSMGGGALLYLALTESLFCRLVLLASPANFKDILARHANMMGLCEKAEQKFYQRLESIAGVPLSELDLTRHQSRDTFSALIIHDEDDRAIPVSDADKVSSIVPEPTLLKTTGLSHTRLLSYKTVVDRVSAYAAVGARCAEKNTRFAKGESSVYRFKPKETKKERIDSIG